MNSKAFFLLGALTIAAVAAASFALSERGSSNAAEADGPLFPDLLERINYVARIEVTTADDSYTVVRDADGWGLEDKGGYPVKYENVTQVAVGLARLTRFEEKTSNPDKYALLGVQGPGEETSGEDGTPSQRVVLEDESGAVLADVILGKTKYGSSPSVYVRVAGEPASWLCQGEVKLATDPNAWLDKTVLQMDRDRLAGTTLTHADGTVVDVSRPSKDQNTYDFAEVPEGRELSNASAGNALGTIFTYLSFDDVKPVDEIDFSAEGAWEVESRTLDGLVVSADLVEVDGVTWARFDASFEELESVDVGPVPAEPEAEGEETPEATEDEGPDPVAVRAEAEELDARLSPWAYALPSYKATTLTKRVEDFLKPLEEEGEGDAEEAPAAE